MTGGQAGLRLPRAYLTLSRCMRLPAVQLTCSRAGTTCMSVAAPAWARVRVPCHRLTHQCEEELPVSRRSVLRATSFKVLLGPLPPVFSVGSRVRKFFMSPPGIKKSWKPGSIQPPNLLWKFDGTGAKRYRWAPGVFGRVSIKLRGRQTSHSASSSHYLPPNTATPAGIKTALISVLVLNQAIGSKACPGKALARDFVILPTANCARSQGGKRRATGPSFVAKDS